jgi:hypothetical protein
LCRGIDEGFIFRGCEGLGGVLAIEFCNLPFGLEGLGMSIGRRDCIGLDWRDSIIYYREIDW